MDAGNNAQVGSVRAADRVHTLVFRSAAELVREPAPHDWLIKNYFENDSLVMLFGDAASGKTWLSLSIAIHVAAGRNFFDHATQQGAVFVVAGEGNRGITRRLAGLLKEYEIAAENLPLFISDGAMSASDDQSVADVISAIQGLAASTHQRPALVVIDTVSRNFGSGDENSTQDMAAFLRACDWIRNELHCTVLLIHHVGHQDKTRARGNTTLRGALDAEYRISRDDAGIIDCVNTKAKDFEAPLARRYVLKNIQLEWRDETGAFVQSAAIVATDAEPVIKGKAGRGKNQIKALEILDDEYRLHRANLTNAGRDSGQALVVARTWGDRCKREMGISRQRMREVEISLAEHGYIRMDFPHVIRLERDA